MKKALTDIQAAILSCIDGETAGNVIRQRLALMGINSSGPGFYRLMGRLKAAGFVSASYRDTGKSLAESIYTTTPSGEAALRKVETFYREISRRIQKRS